MFQSGLDRLDTVALAGLVGALGRLEQDVDDSVRVDRIRLVEELKAAAGAAQAWETAAFAASQRAAQQAQGVPAERVGRGVRPRSGWPGGSRRSTPSATSGGRRS